MLALRIVRIGGPGDGELTKYAVAVREHNNARESATMRTKRPNWGVISMRTSVALLLCMLSASASAVDLNGDGALDNADLEVMRASFYKHDARADLNGDGVVNFADLAILKGAMTGTSAAPLVSPS